MVNFIDSHYGGSAGRALLSISPASQPKRCSRNFKTCNALLELSDSSAKQCAALALIALADAHTPMNVFSKT